MNQIMPTEKSRVATFFVVAIGGVLLGALGMWLFENKLETEVAVLPENVAVENATQIVDYERLVAWNVPDIFTDSVTGKVGNHPLSLIGTGIVKSRTELPPSSQMKEGFKDISVTEPPLNFVIFEMKKIDKEFLKHLTRDPMQDLSGSQIYIGCYLVLDNPEELVGKEVEVPGSGCGTAIHIEAKKPSGEMVYVGSFFH